MIQDAIRTVVEGQHLTAEEAYAVMEQIMSGQATDAQIAAFLTRNGRAMLACECSGR